MSWPFDPWRLRPRPAPAEAPRTWADMWTEATRWWVEPASATADALSASNERVLAELADGVVRQFEGRRVTLSLGGRGARGTIDWIRLRRGDDRHDARLEVQDAEWDVWSFDRLSASAASVRLESRPPARLIVSGIEVIGSTPLARLVAWLDARVADWTLGVGAAGLVEACRPDLGLTLAVEPAVRDGWLELELRAARWRGIRVSVPRWLRLTRTRELPALPRAIAIADARRAGARVEFRATVPVVEEPVDLGRLRDAVARATPYLAGAVLP